MPRPYEEPDGQNIWKMRRQPIGRAAWRFL